MRTTPIAERRAGMLRHVARECGFGEVSLESSSAEHWIQFASERDGAALEVRVTARGGSPWTSVRVACPGAPVELSLRPELPGEGIDKVLGMTVDHELGDAPFDDRFVIQAAPAEAAHHLLSAPVRAELMALLHTDDSPRMLLRAGALSITWQGEANPAAVGRALAASLAIRAAASEMHEGVAVVALGPFRGAGALAAVDPARRALAVTEIRRARARAFTILGTAAAVSVAALLSLLQGTHLGPAVTHGLASLLHPMV